MKSAILSTALLAIAFLPPHAAAASFVLDANLTPLPLSNSTGAGFSELDVSDDLQSFFITVELSGLSGDVAAGTGIYDGNLGTPVVPLNVPSPSFTSGVLSGTYLLPEGALPELLADDLFVDVFTDQTGVPGAVSGFPDSLIAPELGGQLVLAGTPEPGTLAMLSLGLAMFLFLARRYWGAGAGSRISAAASIRAR